MAGYRVDGTLAKQFSRLRHLENREEILRSLWECQPPDRDGYRNMTKEEIAATPEFKERAIKIVRENDVLIQEVYTLFFST